MAREEFLIRDLPDPEAARRFLAQLDERHPAARAQLARSEGLLSDVLTLVSFSPLLAATLLQNPSYIAWLGRERLETSVVSTEDLIESLARFSLTNSQLDPQVLFARFRRRELLRIYLRDIRRLSTVPEVTEEISNLADAILESALRLARREMDNRYGTPLETDAKGRSLSAKFCVVALGKLGSRELNYASDIDLVFVYSAEGKTGGGSRPALTNREYFVKLAEFLIKLVGGPSGEGSAYRVDLRLRPHGRLGPLAMSTGDAVRYYRDEARPWELQVLIRSRGCAGDVQLFKDFFACVEPIVFSGAGTAVEALANVRRSKEQIDRDHAGERGFNVKLGRGGIREIEFIAQALQLAHGGRDQWLRTSHTLISLARLADRKLISDAELTGLAAAYAFLRRTEHILQMENGIQTHSVPIDAEKRELVAARVEFAAGGDFEHDLAADAECVSQVFIRVFGESAEPKIAKAEIASTIETGKRALSHLRASIEKSDLVLDEDSAAATVLDRVNAVSPHFAAVLAANPHLAVFAPDAQRDAADLDYTESLVDAVECGEDLGGKLAALRRTWTWHLMEIVVLDVFQRISISEAKRRQTLLAEASITAALVIVRFDLAGRYNIEIPDLPLAVLALGKLGGRGLDYDSDLDLVLAYDQDTSLPVAGLTNSEFYGRVVELFVTALSAMTGDGSLYRVDLRLRPYGSKGQSSISASAFMEYMSEKAAIWEMLAFVKLRAVGGDIGLATHVENEIRKSVHQRAAEIPEKELQAATHRMRLALERGRGRSGREVDIKYGSGGMLDVYFATRFLQLRDNIPDIERDRATAAMLSRLRDLGSLDAEMYEQLNNGYHFLTTLDHELRLTIGRTTRVPLGNRVVLATIAERMGYSSVDELLEKLAFQRIAVHEAFNCVLGPA